MNIITKKQYPDIWKDLMAFQIKETYHEHRRNSNYYTCWLLKFDQENLPEHPELHGLWETDTFIGDHEYGCDDYPDELHRVEEKRRMIEEVYYERVKA
jgi:hypothetical protein